MEWNTERITIDFKNPWRITHVRRINGVRTEPCFFFKTLNGGAQRYVLMFGLTFQEQFEFMQLVHL